MNWADYAIIGVLLLSVLVGLWRGLISEVTALATWVAAVWLAWLYGPFVAAWFRGTIDVPSLRIIVGYGLCFIVVLVLGALFKFIIDRLVEGTGLSGSDRMLGMVFGLARGLLLVTVLVFVLGFTPFTRDAWWHQSRLLPTFTAAASWLNQRLPVSVRRYLHPYAVGHPHIESLGEVRAWPGGDVSLPATVNARATSGRRGIAIDPGQARKNRVR